MYKFYVVDYFSKKYYGPFKNCKKAKQAARLVTEFGLSDVLLEEGTNIIVTDDFDIIPAYFEKSDINQLKESTEQLIFGEV